MQETNQTNSDLYEISPDQLKNAHSKKIVAGICGILLGGLGVHKFYLGYITPGIIMVLITLITPWFTCGFGAIVMGIIGLIEGILYLTKSDKDFYETYILNSKGWF
ncbi:TM2 domain-containing protein [Apibacter sp. B2966]|uniref:TM2 domain-containing protein n=1 Tax=Apibacter sp. B2966 TaxID=2656761 RepID=UPI0016254325|nr:TM2 domain-containing protein [Apibacter sp. B2966]